MPKTCTHPDLVVLEVKPCPIDKDTHEVRLVECPGCGERRWTEATPKQPTPEQPEVVPANPEVPANP